MPRKLSTILSSPKIDRQITEICRSALDNSFVYTVTLPAPGMEFSIKHGLDRAPIGYMIVGDDDAVVKKLYDGTTANTKELLYLRSTGALNQVIKILVF